MALQSSGPISLLNIQDELGGSNPISLNEYYGSATGVPASGTLSLSTFYGKIKPVNFNVTIVQCMDHYATLYYDGAGIFYIQSKEPSGNIHTGRGDCGGLPQGQILYVTFNPAGFTSLNFVVTQSGRDGSGSYTGTSWSLTTPRTQDLPVVDGNGGAGGYTFNITGTAA
jgi:hypothetical protein